MGVTPLPPALQQWVLWEPWALPRRQLPPCPQSRQWCLLPHPPEHGTVNNRILLGGKYLSSARFSVTTIVCINHVDLLSLSLSSLFQVGRKQVKHHEWPLQDDILSSHLGHIVLKSSPVTLGEVGLVNACRHCVIKRWTSWCTWTQLKLSSETPVWSFTGGVTNLDH